MSSIGSSLARFMLYFIISTVVFGGIGMLITQSRNGFMLQFFSVMIMLPYMISFYLMSQHFIKKYQIPPTNKQRWQLSFGCLGIFWLYAIVVSLISFFISGSTLSNESMVAMMFLIMIAGVYVIGVNLMLVCIGYWFLGKPTEIMLKHHQTQR